MANYLMRYKGKYRLKAPIDENTNDYPRDVHGKIETDDVYIDCAYGNQIYHYGYGVLVAYVPSIGRGHNILMSIGEELLGKEIMENLNRDYDKLYELLLKERTIREIRQNDGEIEFKFKAKDIELVAKYLKPKTGGAGISPFSSRNLPKPNQAYSIPEDNLKEYKKIIADIPKDKLVILSQITRSFLSDIVAKKPYYKSISVKADMKKKMLKSKEYIHSIGLWDEYIKYLSKKLKERLDETKEILC